MKFSAVLFDRDGTVIFDRHYLKDPSGVELIPGIGKALKLLAGQGADAFLVSNQSGIGRGYFSTEDLESCQARMKELLLREGASFKDARFCPHAPEERCLCRKPSTGMWESLRDTYGLDPARCAMIGDKEEDLLFGRNAGMPFCVLVLTGKGRMTAARLGVDVDVSSALLKPIGNIRGSDSDLHTCRFFIANNACEAVQGLLAL